MWAPHFLILKFCIAFAAQERVTIFVIYSPRIVCSNAYLPFKAIDYVRNCNAVVGTDFITDDLTALINGVCLGMIQSITILSNRPEFQHRKSFRLQLSVPVFPFRDEKAGNLWDWQSEWLSLTLNGYVLRPITFNVASSWSIYHHFIYPSFVDFQLA